MSALSLDEIAAGPLDGAVWGFTAAPEFRACESRLYCLNGDVNRAARCSVLHAETGATGHSASVNGHRVFWSDQDAAHSLSAWLLLPACANCGARYRGDGSYCGARCELADKQISRDYQLDEVA